MSGTLHEDQNTLMIISRSYILIIKNATDKIIEKIIIHILYSVISFHNLDFYVIMWKNNVGQR
jgi:hypothetical protein